MSGTRCPNWGEGGRGNSGNARKKTFFFKGGVPLPPNCLKEILNESGAHADLKQIRFNGTWFNRREKGEHD